MGRLPGRERAAGAVGWSLSPAHEAGRAAQAPWPPRTSPLGSAAAVFLAPGTASGPGGTSGEQRRPPRAVFFSLSTGKRLRVLEDFRVSCSFLGHKTPCHKAGWESKRAAGSHARPGSVKMHPGWARRLQGEEQERVAAGQMLTAPATTQSPFSTDVHPEQPGKRKSCCSTSP